MTDDEIALWLITKGTKAEGMTMTDMEPDKTGWLLRHLRAQNADLRKEIMREIAVLPQADLRRLLRMIETWKGRGDE